MPGRSALGIQTNRRLMTQEFPFFAVRTGRSWTPAPATTPGLEAIFYNAHNEFTWQPTVLLAPLLVSDDGETVRRKLAATATLLDIWVMRRAANYVRVGYSGVSYAMYTLCRDIRDLALPDLIDTLQTVGPGRGDLRQLRRPRATRHQRARSEPIQPPVYLPSAGPPDRLRRYCRRPTGPASRHRRPRSSTHSTSNTSGPGTPVRFAQEFSDTRSFEEARNNIGGLLLPADVNRSYQDKAYEGKIAQYARQNFWAASLHPSAYEHQPQFTSFIAREGLPFKAYDHFGKAEQEERNALVHDLANKIWSPSSWTPTDDRWTRSPAFEDSIEAPAGHWLAPGR